MHSKPTPEAVTADSEGRCVVCGKEESPRRRGLCQADYERFRRAKMMVPLADREAFDDFAVSAGKILPSRQGRKLAAGEDVFRSVLAEFRKHHKIRD